jgi:hypothetical protein
MWSQSGIRSKAGKWRRNSSSKPHLSNEASDFRSGVNMSFTDDSSLPATVLPQSDATSEGQGFTAMTIWTHLTTCAVAIREFVAPTYRPERHYMRGPGPACARRRTKVSIDARASFR